MARSLFSCLLLIGLCWLAIGCGTASTLTTIMISPSSASIGLNKTMQFFANGYDQSGNLIGFTPTWSVSGMIGIIDSTGKFTAGSSIATGSISVQGGSVVATATVTVTDKGVITGRVRNLDGTNVTGLTVFLRANPTKTALTDASGYTLTGVTPGIATVETQANTLYLSATAEVSVATGETATKNFILAPRLVVISESFSSSIGFVQVTGKVQNNGATTAESSAIAYTFYADDGSPVSAGSQALGNIAPGANASFSVVPSPSITSDQYTTVKSVAACQKF